MAKKRAILSVLDEIKEGIDGINDGNGLNRVLALLTQASASIKAAAIPMDTQIQQLKKKDHFYPTQKNEIQLRFKKTASNPGRKKLNVTLRYTWYMYILAYIHECTRVISTDVQTRSNKKISGLTWRLQPTSMQVVVLQIPV